LRGWFAGQLLGIEESIINRWAILMAQRQLKGRPLDILDGLLAATALHYRLTVVTRNVRDFPWVDHPHSKPFDDILDLQARMIARQGVRGVRTAECGVHADGEPGKGVVLRPAGDCRVDAEM
jgi:hypothetical protein